MAGASVSLSSIELLDSCNTPLSENGRPTNALAITAWVLPSFDGLLRWVKQHQ